MTLLLPAVAEISFGAEGTVAGVAVTSFESAPSPTALTALTL